MKIKTKFQMHQNIKFGIIVMIGLILSIYVSDFFLSNFIAEFTIIY